MIGGLMCGTIVGWRMTMLGSRWAGVVTVPDHERFERLYRNRAARKRTRARRRHR